MLFLSNNDKENIHNEYRKFKRKNPDLITFMEEVGYSKDYIARIRREVNRILTNAENKSWSSYYDVYIDYAQRSNCVYSRHLKRVILGLIEHFEVYEQYPDGKQRHQLVQYGNYHLLTDEFRAVIDYYCTVEKKRGIKDSTIYGNSSNAASFLLELQKIGISDFKAVTEKDILSVFVSPDGSLCRCYGYKKNIASVFKACIPQDLETFTKILTFLPAIKNTRKNAKYLLPEEIGCIKQTLSDKHSPLSLRNKAIGTLALYTGLRSCDIAGLKVDSIDWEKDLILIKQQKTGVQLELPLFATVGNAIYDYMTLERPETECEYIFISYSRPYKRLKADSLTDISVKIMESAGMKKLQGNRGGFRVFRHHLATGLLGNGIPEPIISSILGHTSPNSLVPYLSADFHHLKKCAIGLESFPIRVGVFENV